MEGTDLDNLREAICEFAFGEGSEKGYVYEYVFGLPECTDEILSEGGVDGGLSSDGGVDHGEEGCGYLHDADTAHAVESERGKV